jgi:hypothetical protein
MGGYKLKNFRRIEAATSRSDLRAARRNVREDVKTGSMTQGADVQNPVAWPNSLEIEEISQGHGAQVAMGQFGALRLSSGPTGVKDPSCIIRRAIRDRNGWATDQLVVRRASDYDYLEIGGTVGGNIIENWNQIVRDKADLGLTVA